MTARFRETGKGSFWADYVYEQVVPKNHFLTLVQHAREALAVFLLLKKSSLRAMMILTRVANLRHDSEPRMNRPCSG